MGEEHFQADAHGCWAYKHLFPPVSWGRWAVYRGKAFMPKHQCQQSPAMVLCRQLTVHSGVKPVPAWWGHRGPKGQLLPGISSISNHKLIGRQAVFVEGDFES